MKTIFTYIIMVLAITASWLVLDPRHEENQNIYTSSDKP